MPSVVRAGALAILAACVLSSQPPAPSGLPRADEPFRVEVNAIQEPFRVDVNLVEVDAVVHDSRGRYPATLRREDFEIREDGKLQEITSFSYEALPRNIAIFVANCDSTGMLRVGAGGGLWSLLHEFIEERLKLDDRLAIVPCLEGSGTLHRLSGDKELLHRAEVVLFSEPRVWFPDSAIWFCNVESWEGPTSCNIVYSSRGQPTFAGAPSFEAIRSAVEGLSMARGRKILVVISSFTGWKEIDKDSPQVRELAERVNRAGIVLYVLDPGDGVPYPEVQFDASMAAEGRSMLPPVMHMQSGHSDALDALAEASGGFAMHLGPRAPSRTSVEEIARGQAHLLRMRAFLKEGLERIDREASGYYLMSYNPGALEAQRSRFHRIEVRTRQPGLTVRARSGYYARSERTPQAELGTSEERLRAAVLTTLQGGELSFRMRLFDHAGEPDPRTGQRQPMVRTMLAIEPRELTLEPQPDGSLRAEVEVRAAAFGGEIEAAATKSATCSAKAPAGGLARRRLVCSLDLPVPKPGGYVVRVAVRDVASGRIGSAWVTGKLHYRPPDEISLSQMTVTLAPTVASPGEMMPTDSNPVDQVFAPGATLVYALDVYRPWAKQRKKPKLVAKVALSTYVPVRRYPIRYQGRETEFGLLYESELLPIRAEEGSATATAAGKLTLPPNLKPGEYNLLVAVYDLTVTSEKAIEKGIELRLGGKNGPGPGPFRGSWISKEPVVYADAYLTVVPAGGPAPARVHDPMGYVRPLLEKYPNGLP